MIQTAKVVCFVFCFGSTGDQSPRSDFCDVLRNTIRNELKFTADELAHLRRENKVDLRALKRTYGELCKGSA